MKIVSRSLIVALSLGIGACTEAGETTQMAAATGGVMGAGLGAIIGSQTGSAGGGLVLGALAGGAAGGAIGNALESQEKTIRTQDEAIERQERTISAQRTELEELRRMNQETPGARMERQVQQNVYGPHASFGGIRQQAPVVSANPSFDAARGSANLATTLPESTQSRSPMREATLVDRSAEYQGRGIESQPTELHSNTAASLVAAAPQGANPISQMGNDVPNQALGAGSGAVAARMNPGSTRSSTPECIQAEGEIGKANGSNELADKLFHYRRALRLCPDNPAYHNGLGEIYLALNRKADAEFEFHEALKVDQNFMPAQSNLNNLR